MGKKRKAVRQPDGPAGPRELDPVDARLGPITTYEDIADEQEEYFLNQDKILLEDEPQSKRLRRQTAEDDFLEPSDEEILGNSDNSDEQDPDDDDDDNEEDDVAPGLARLGGKRNDLDEEGDGDGDEGDEGRDPGWWGSSRKEYYSAENIQTEADALEEAAEARRLQQRKLAKMSEADFVLDEAEWLAPAGSGANDADVVTEKLQGVEITDDMKPDEKYQMLQTRYPEFDYLVDEFRELQPLLSVLKREAAGKASKSVEVLKYWILGCLVASLASYFAILTSPARDGGEQGHKKKLLDAAELRDHDVMETLVACRQAWLKAKAMKSIAKSVSRPAPAEQPSVRKAVQASATGQVEKKVSNKSRVDGAAAAAARRQQKKEKGDEAVQEMEDSLADLSDLLAKTSRSSRPKTSALAAAAAAAPAGDDDSDFGEEETMDARTAADKAAKKKSLRFYTSQIVQKANRRADAGRDAGGDVDIPFKERLRDRQARLATQAERRGRKGSQQPSGDVGDGSDQEAAGGTRDDGDHEYYNLFVAKKKEKTEEKARDALGRRAAASDDARRRSGGEAWADQTGPDGKRKITRAIAENKGLTRHRKDNRNPRVKKRKQFEKKTAKLRSMRPVYGGGEDRRGYAGELTGIKTGLIKSVKL